MVCHKTFFGGYPPFLDAHTHRFSLEIWVEGHGLDVSSDCGFSSCASLGSGWAFGDGKTARQPRPEDREECAGGWNTGDFGLTSLGVGKAHVGHIFFAAVQEVGITGALKATY